MQWADWAIDLMNWDDGTVDDTVVSYIVMMLVCGLVLIEAGYWHDWFQRRKERAMNDSLDG